MIRITIGDIRIVCTDPIRHQWPTETPSFVKCGVKEQKGGTLSEARGEQKSKSHPFAPQLLILTGMEAHDFSRSWPHL